MTLPFVTRRPVRLLVALAAGAALAYLWPPLLPAVQLGAAALAVALVADALLLWGRGGARAARATDDILSMGDPNPVTITVESRYAVPVRVTVLDEAPVAFQKRDAAGVVTLPPGGAAEVRYTVRPTARGAYGFGATHLYVASPLGLLERRITAPTAAEARVYPSVIQMRRLAFLADPRRMGEAGARRVRRAGTTLELDQIAAYVPGDDRRAVNWKATARRGGALHVNRYTDERSQPVIVALDMGRAMRSPFDGLTLLDHSINAALVLLNTALRVHDRAGLVTFDHEVRTVRPPSRGPGTLPALLDALYRQEPSFLDPGYEALHAALTTRVGSRALVLLFAHFDTRAALDRQLPYLRRIGRRHRLVVVLFENTGIRDLLAARSERLEDVYVKAAAEALAMETREVARALERAGVGALVTRPETLSVDAVNRYLALKAAGAV